MEHRIVLARIIFLLDIVVFGGWNIFTVIVNYVCVTAIGYVFWRQYRNGATNKYSPLLIGGLIFGFIFLWCQNENLKWGFQSQGLMIYLFSMLAFARFSRIDGNPNRIPIVIVLCVLATLSMGNGVVSFFIVAIQALLLRRPGRESITAIIAGSICAAIYFYGLRSPGLPIDSTVAHIRLARIEFFTIFMGNPIFAIYPNLRAASLIGTALLVISVFAVLPIYLKREITPYRSFLIATYGMMVAAALAASNFRWMDGLHYAVTSRYSTPTVLAYASLSLLILDIVAKPLTRTAAALASVAFLTVLSISQKGVFLTNSTLYDWRLAVLGTKIGMDHQNYDALIYPSTHHDRYLKFAAMAAEDRIGPYAKGWLHDAGVVKYDPDKRNDSLCVGFLDAVHSDEFGTTANGWIVAKTNSDDPLLVVLANAAGETVGYGVTGINRPDVMQSIPGARIDAGWVGFISKQHTLTAYGYFNGEFCKLQSATSNLVSE